MNKTTRSVPGSLESASTKRLSASKSLLALIAALAILSAGTYVRSEDLSDSSSDVQASVSVDSDTSEAEIEEPPYQPKTKAELKRSLTSIQYKVTQNEETEPAFRNKYWDNKEEGIYRCIVCEQSLFSSETKYKSGTGWPSFYDPIKPNHVGYKNDFHLFFPRKEVHCSRCKAHLGHVFNDGPQDKTGKRYCMNSAALKFVSAEELKAAEKKSVKE